MARVLIIEDDSSMQTLFASAFTLRGFEVVVAGDAGVGFIRLEEELFDLILLDLMLPGQSGLDFLKAYQLKYLGKKTHIIVMSNIDNPVIVDKVKTMGISGYFVKSNQDPHDVVAYAEQLLATGLGSAPTA